MSKFQIPYEQAKKKMILTRIPEFQNKIRELQSKITQTTDPDEKKGLKAEIDALNIKIKSYRRKDPVREQIENEDAQGAITMGNVGSPTMATGEPAKGGSSALYYPKVGPMMSRRGDIKSKKKKKKIREFNEFYFSENEEKVVPYGEQIERELRKANKEKNAEKVVYYSQAFDKSAVASFERFKGSWAYNEWKKKNQEAIQKVEQEFKRFSWR